jgi:hypothetical protein
VQSRGDPAVIVLSSKSLGSPASTSGYIPGSRSAESSVKSSSDDEPEFVPDDETVSIDQDDVATHHSCGLANVTAADWQ